MLDPVPPLANPYTATLSAYLQAHPIADRPPTEPEIQAWLDFFQHQVAQGDLATAVRILALPFSGRSLHQWLLERQDLTTHLRLTQQLTDHPAVNTLTPSERAFLATLPAERLIYHLPPLPVPGDLPVDYDIDGPPPPPTAAAPGPDLTTAIGQYRIAYRLYDQVGDAVPALYALDRLITLSLRTGGEARLVEAAAWAKQGITRAQILRLPAITAAFLYQLAIIQNALDEDLAAHLTLLQLLHLPAPGAPSALLANAWRFLGHLYEFYGDPIDAMVCYLHTLPPTDTPPRAETLPNYVSGVLAAFDLGQGQTVVNQAYARLHDPAWSPQPFPATSLPPYPEAPGELDDYLDDK